jgi:hypothetical protein
MLSAICNLRHYGARSPTFEHSGASGSVPILRCFMNWQSIKRMKEIGDRVLFGMAVFVVLSYPLEWIIRYVRLR